MTALEWEVIGLSLWVSVWATMASLPVAIAVAMLLERGRFWGRSALAAVIYLPLVLPPVVTGYMLLVSFGPTSGVGIFLASIGVSFAFNAKGAALAAAVMAFPLFVRSIQLALSNVDRGFEDTARTLGAGEWRVFFTITLPLAKSGVFAGAVLAFAKAMGEFGATITFVSNIPGETQTIASAIYAMLQVPGQESAVVRLIVISAVFSLGAIVVSELMLRRAGRHDT